IALSEMGAGALRFPYGALSNNYLWTKDPQDLVDGPEPCVAVPGRAPGGWDWAVDEQGFFKKDLGFDEYVSLCRKIGAEPVVCVNIMSHVYKPDDEITIDTLIYYAREWVRYANITKGYGIKYWQLGNEQDHHSDIYPQAAFKSDYKKMAMAMLEVDPTIKTGPGLLNRWNDEMLRYCPEYVEFITCHQYLWFGGNEWEGYDAWKDYGKTLIPHITDNLAYVRASSKPDLEIFVTETGITGGRYPDPQVFNLYKGLVLFEMQMEMIITSNVKNTFYWGTHTPWNGEDGDAPLATLFSNDSANKNHMQADILSNINRHIQEDYIGKLSGSGIVTYSTISDNDSLMVVYALNKNSIPKNIRISTENTGSFRDLETWVFAGRSEFDAEVKFVPDNGGTVDEHSVETNLPPLSITILRLGLNDDGGNTSINHPTGSKEIKVYPNPAEDMLNIEGAEAFEKNAALTITDMAGKICQRQNNLQTSVINISSLKPGVYTMQITEGNNIYRSVFIRR
ncbi:MAG: T9SS type A sorting domain-containing protein, partial [Bacteroidetes bacterium]|nr:T9SS type A sorting domain-containing protein [Bacteroidota bacterium]